MTKVIVIPARRLPIFMFRNPTGGDVVKINKWAFKQDPVTFPGPIEIESDVEFLEDLVSPIKVWTK